MKRFVISEDERKRILSMHEAATKRHYLSEQVSTQQGQVAQPQGKIKYTESSGSASAVPIVNSNVLSDLGVPATPENFSNTFFYTDRRGLASSFANKNMNAFTSKSKRTTQSPDNVVARYKNTDGSTSVIKLEGEGTKEFPTKGLEFIGGAGNGLLALSRAIRTATGTMTSVIKITLGGDRSGSSYTYDSGKVNDTTATFNSLAAHFLIPYNVDLSKANPTWSWRDYFDGTPPTNWEGLLGSLNAKFLPTGEKYNQYEGLTNMVTPEIKSAIQSVKPGMSPEQITTNWNNFVTLVKKEYKENLRKFLIQKFGEEKANQYLNSFNPKTGTTPVSILNSMKHGSGPGTTYTQPKAQQSQTSQTFKSGQ